MRRELEGEENGLPGQSWVITVTFMAFLFFLYIYPW